LVFNFVVRSFNAVCNVSVGKGPSIDRVPAASVFTAVTSLPTAGKFAITVSLMPSDVHVRVAGGLINVLTIDVNNHQICTVRSVINPDKLGHLGLPLSQLAQRARP
jgi:hypothetical protein